MRYNRRMKKTISALLASAVIMVPLIASADDFTHWLTIGSRGSEVFELQTILHAAGFLSVAPTGYYGAMTQNSVMAFQKKYNLEQVGSVGPKTRALLNAYVAAAKNTQLTPPSSAPTATTTSLVSASTSVPTPSPAPVLVSTTTAASENNPPQVTLGSPASVIPRSSTQTTFSVTTDTPANCRYGTQPGMQLTYMTPFTYTGGTTHTSTLTNLAPDALYVYYVRCTDMSDRQSQEVTVSFSVTGQ